MNDELRKMAEEAGLEHSCRSGYPGQDCGDNFWQGEDAKLEAFARLVAADCINPWPPHWCVPVPEGCAPYSFAEGIRCMQDAIRAKYGIKP